MAPTRFKSITLLEENSTDIFMESTEVLIKIARNILSEPSNPKFRSISIGSKIVTNKLLPASGAMECLFEMGFQEGEDKLIFPQAVSLEPLKCLYSELMKTREQHRNTNKPPEVAKKVKRSETDDSTALISKDLMTLTTQIKDPFLKKIIFWCFYVLKYENYDLQLKALKLVPITELNLKVVKNIRKIQEEIKKKQLSNKMVDYQELLLAELCNWFNTDFFTWVDTPQCTKCNFLKTVYVGMSTEKFPGAERVEEYKCQKCNEKVLFPRYSDPNKLLETKKGRCGEWANCFCLFARAFGWDARLVCDETDHVWIEVYSFVKARWIHCDPCENVIDTPLMYECGWKKKLSYIIAYSRDEIQDVTWRYSCKHAEVLKNRQKCSEQDLVDFIIKVRSIMLSRASPVRRAFVIKRTVLELVELMKQRSANEAEEKGRISGSLAWRLLRGETTNDESFKPFVWRVEQDEERTKKLTLSYITSKDEYVRNSKTVFKNWKEGLFSLKSVFKKEEKDWKMTYLARTEGSVRGILSWKFDTGDKLAIGTISLKLIRSTFETGMISCKLCSDDSCVLVPNGRFGDGCRNVQFTALKQSQLKTAPWVSDNESFLTDAFMGLKSVELVVELFGGNGPNAWQQAQILRQPLNSQKSTFTIVLNLVEI